LRKKGGRLVWPAGPQILIISAIGGTSMKEVMPWFSARAQGCPDDVWFAAREEGKSVLKITWD
jgi:hypothetical protein